MICSIQGNFETKEDSDYRKIIEIEEAIRLTEQMSSEVDKYTKLRNLAYENEIKTIKSSISTMSYTYLCEGARKWIEMQGGKIEITKVTQYGFDAYAWEIKFKYNDKLFEITIPIIEKLDKNNFTYTKGMFSIGYCDKEHSTTVFKTSFIEREIMRAFKEFLGTKDKI